MNVAINPVFRVYALVEPDRVKYEDGEQLVLDGKTR